MDTLWSYLIEKRVVCSNKLEKDIQKYIKKVRDIYVPSGHICPYIYFRILSVRKEYNRNECFPFYCERSKRNMITMNIFLFIMNGPKGI